MIHLVRLRMSNAYIVRGERTIIIDTGSAHEEHKLLRALDWLGIPRDDVSLILQTHAHPDHAGSTKSLLQTLRVPTAVHPDDAEMLSAGVGRLMTPIRWAGRVLYPIVPKTFPPVQADVLVHDGQRLDEYGVPARILHTPGHTAGSVCVLFDTGDVIAGDLLMGGHLFGTILSSKPRHIYFAEDFNRLQKSLHHLLSLATGTIYVGHGGPVTAEAARTRLL